MANLILFYDSLERYFLKYLLRFHCPVLPRVFSNLLNDTDN